MVPSPLSLYMREREKMCIFLSSAPELLSSTNIFYSTVLFYTELVQEVEKRDCHASCADSCCYTGSGWSSVVSNTTVLHEEDLSFISAGIISLSFRLH